VARRTPALDLRSGPERVRAHLLADDLLVSVVNHTAVELLASAAPSNSASRRIAAWWPRHGARADGRSALRRTAPLGATP
jgi:hypothetical protein